MVTPPQTSSRIAQLGSYDAIFLDTTVPATPGSRLDHFAQKTASFGEGVMRTRVRAEWTSFQAGRGCRGAARGQVHVGELEDVHAERTRVLGRA